MLSCSRFLPRASPNSGFVIPADYFSRAALGEADTKRSTRALAVWECLFCFLHSALCPSRAHPPPRAHGLYIIFVCIVKLCVFRDTTGRHDPALFFLVWLCHTSSVSHIGSTINGVDTTAMQGGGAKAEAGADERRQYGRTPLLLVVTVAGCSFVPAFGICRSIRGSGGLHLWT